MTQTVLPTKAVDNWEGIRDEWVASVEQLVGDAEIWAGKQDWAVRREAKSIREDRLGQYTVPRLLIQATAGRLLLDPVARYVPGVLGVVDLYVLPSYDAVMISRADDGWRLHPIGADDVPQPWSEETFVHTALQLLATA
jgi:hypothetical protein